MIDRYCRDINYLRLSVTDKCNLNCAYCKRTENKERGIITFNEIERVVMLFSKLGIKKIRLTGGEPLVREDIIDIVRLCRDTLGISEVVMTTNGILLAEKVEMLKSAGLDRVNVSIDSLDDNKYKKIARANCIDKVLNSIDSAVAAGLNPVKINVVLMRGKNDDELDSFIELTKYKPVEVRFIEYMPMGGSLKSQYISENEVVSTRPHLRKIYGNTGVANQYTIDGYKGKIGFISPMSQPFCNSCNRIRIMPDCKMRLCLGNNHEIDLREIFLRNDDEALGLIESSIYIKPQKGFCSEFVTNRGMGNIGG